MPALGTDHGGSRVDDEEDQLLRHMEELDYEEAPPTPAKRTFTRPPGLFHRMAMFLSGPQPPRPQAIKPLWPALQRAPPKLVDRIIGARCHRKPVLLAMAVTPWVLALLFLLRAELPVLDPAGNHIVNLDCVDTLWRRKNECGLDGIDCRPFSNVSMAFRCPAKCDGVQLLNPHAVGPIEVNYRPLVVGDGVYRGDSFVCSSAIHAGVFGSGGGCGRLSLVGEQREFGSSIHNGIESISFDSYFPLSFSVSRDESFKCRPVPRFGLLIMSILTTSIISLFSASPFIFFPIFTLIFAHVSFASDPPSASYRNFSVVPDHVSMFAKRFLPAVFCAVVLYRTVIKRTLSGLDAQCEKTILWLGGFWFGALSNYTLEWIPISRLSAHDLDQQPGAKIALAFIIFILVCIIAQQAYFFWLEGRLPTYLSLYGGFIIGIVVLTQIPGVSLRIHHYILALLLLPGTSIQTRPSLLYQGLLLGLLCNGIARWDFDSILQTADALRNDAKLGSALPALMAPVIHQGKITVEAVFSWEKPPVGVDGISVLVNDVERDRAFFTDDDVGTFTWSRDVGLEVPEYLRFAFIKEGRALDYTKAGTLFANATWSMEESG